MEAQANEALRELRHRIIAIGLNHTEIAQLEDNIHRWSTNAPTRLIAIDHYYSYYRDMTEVYFNLKHSN